MLWYAIVKVNVHISEHFGVFQSLLFEDVRIIFTGDVHLLGLNSELTEIDHLTDKQSPDIQFLCQLHSPLG